MLRRAGLNPFALTATASARAPSVSDLAAVSGLDHQEAPVEFLVSEPESVVQKPFAENRGDAVKQNRERLPAVRLNVHHLLPPLH